MSFRTKLFLAFFTLAAFTVIGSILVVNGQFHRVTESRIREQFRFAAFRFDDFQQERLRNLVVQAGNMAYDPSLRGTLSTGDEATVERAASDVHRLYDTDLFRILDTDGILIAVSDTLEAVHPVDYINQVVVHDALQGFDSGDIWKLGDAVYHVAAAPILTGNVPLGILLIGTRFSHGVIREYSSLTDEEIAIVSDAVQSSSLLEPVRTSMIHKLRSSPVFLEDLSLPSIPDFSGTRDQDRESEIPFFEIEVEDEVFAGTGFTLTDISGEELTRGFVFRSTAPEQELLRRIQTALASVGGGVVLIALIASLVLTRGLTRPIQHLVRSSEKLGTGDLDTPIKPAAADEIGSLAKALDDMRISLKKAREDLIRQERLSAIGQMASTITHDFRQPISAMMGYIQLMTMPGFDADKREEMADKVIRQIERMQRMITEVLDFSKGEIRLSVVHQPLMPLIEEVGQNFSKDFENRNIQWLTDIQWHGELPFDYDRLERGIENIVRNAMQAIGNKGTIRLGTSREETTLVISIEDDGPGMPEEVRKRLFEAFYTEGKKGGTGLGLAVAQRVVDEHGGRIDVDSVQGEGTRFEIRLPLTSDKEVETHEQRT